MKEQPEHLIHWIWETLQFETRSLKTERGERILLAENGVPNPTDGPDFQNAALHIGPLEWHGDVEIHRYSGEWYRHGHHTDPRYNRVVLHVVWKDNHGQNVRRQDGTEIPTLALQHYLFQPLQQLLEKYEASSRQPACTATLHYINPKAFKRQLEKAHRSYFEHKVEQLMDWYPATVSISEAWKSVLVLSLFDGLGISANRHPMVAYGTFLLHNHPYGIEDRNSLHCFALENFEWNHKAVRPPNHPHTRLKQAHTLYNRLAEIPFRTFLNQDPIQLWNSLMSKAPGENLPGAGRASVLYYTAYLPAIYLLGNLLQSKRHRHTAYNEWMDGRCPLPASIRAFFNHPSLPGSYYQNRLGAVYQKKQFCDHLKCSNCEVLKSALHS